ncbi:nitroreductase family protein [Oribacterium sinus]|uniref:nitroreductase family protein n=1 Tax=Oribacterium sinus TaxID=237576 RepID=UPI0028EEC038|nr:nitroreductase family protein [Oribacterium sinus]
MVKEVMMTLREAMEKRHMVRKYKDEVIPQDVVKALEERIQECNQKYSLHFFLKTEDGAAFAELIDKLITKNAKNYIVLAGDEKEGVEERVGYASADIMLYAQTLGLNTWWVGASFNKEAVAKLSPEHPVYGVISLGYGETQGTPHASKEDFEVCSYEGTVPDWFKEGVEYALMAPTAYNRQSFYLKGKGNEVQFTYKEGEFQGIDSGLVKYHFEAAAGKENFHWV